MIKEIACVVDVVHILSYGFGHGFPDTQSSGI